MELLKPASWNGSHKGLQLASYKLFKHIIEEDEKTAAKENGDNCKP